MSSPGDWQVPGDFSSAAFWLVAAAVRRGSDVTVERVGLNPRRTALIPSIIAVIINYVKRDAVRGTWLESHFRWQIRTFWFALLWAVLVALVSAPLALVLIGIGTWVLGMGLLGLWAIYRIGRGWLALNSHQATPLPN